MARDVSPGAAAGISIVASLLFSALDRAALQNELDLLQAVQPLLDGFDPSRAVQQHVGGLAEAKAGKDAAQAIQVTVHLRHGLAGDQEPIYTPKFIALVRYGGTEEWLDTASGTCAFERPDANVAFRGQRRHTSVAIAALCVDNPKLALDPAGADMVWVLSR